MKFILLIYVKMPTIVGILTFISRINTASGSFKARKIIGFFIILDFMSSCNFMLVFRLCMCILTIFGNVFDFV